MSSCRWPWQDSWNKWQARSLDVSWCLDVLFLVSWAVDGDEFSCCRVPKLILMTERRDCLLMPIVYVIVLGFAMAYLARCCRQSIALSFKCNETWAALVSIIISLLAKAAVIRVPLFQWWLLRCGHLTSVIMCDLVIPLVYIFSWRCSCCSASVVLLLLTFCIFKGSFFWRFEGTIVPHAGWSCLLVGGKLFVQLCWQWERMARCIAITLACIQLFFPFQFRFIRFVVSCCFLWHLTCALVDTCRLVPPLLGETNRTGRRFWADRWPQVTRNTPRLSKLQMVSGDIKWPLSNDDFLSNLCQAFHHALISW